MKQPVDRRIHNDKRPAPSTFRALLHRSMVTIPIRASIRISSTSPSLSRAAGIYRQQGPHFSPPNDAQPPRPPLLHSLTLRAALSPLRTAVENPVLESPQRRPRRPQERLPNAPLPLPKRTTRSPRSPRPAARHPPGRILSTCG